MRNLQYPGSAMNEGPRVCRFIGENLMELVIDEDGNEKFIRCDDLWTYQEETA